MKYNQITKKREKLLALTDKQKKLMSEITADIMSELEDLVKKNNGRIRFKKPVDFRSKGWSMIAYSVVWFDYYRWDRENNCEEHHEQLCIDERTGGIPCESCHPEQDNLYCLEWWAKPANKTGLLYMVYEAAIEAIK